MMRRVAQADLCEALVPVHEAGAGACMTDARERSRLIASLEDDLIDVLMRGLQRLVGEELRLAPEHIRTVAREELKKLERAKAIVVFVHPEDAALLGPLRDDASLPSFNIESDDTLARGDCILSSVLGDVDARMHTKLTRFERLLREQKAGD